MDSLTEHSPACAELTRLIARHAPAAGDHATAIPGLTLHRRHAGTEPIHCIYPLGLTVVAQGAKRVVIGTDVVDYRPGQCMLTTVDQPIVSHVVQASPAVPFLAVVLALDVQGILQAASELEAAQPDAPLPVQQQAASVTIAPLAQTLEQAVTRLVRLLDEPELTHHLHPLVRQEIVVRLLVGQHAQQLRQLVVAPLPAQQVARAMAWLKENFARDFRVDELAARVHMSPSSFREHFRAVARMSPLQFQKQLRLQQARQLMINRSLDAAQAARLVGYGSASQFSREYGRLFGAPPQRDLQALRRAGFSAK